MGYRKSRQALDDEAITALLNRGRFYLLQDKQSNVILKTFATYESAKRAKTRRSRIVPTMQFLK